MQEARTTRGAPTLGYAKTAVILAYRHGREQLRKMKFENGYQLP
jgi:hypothetical protein